jgi:putative FmdB family regulatory protein
MPIYEYVCERCGESTEAIQRLADPPLTECPKCGGRLRKKVSAPAFQFKGSGWYVTDYARKGNGGGKKDDAGSSSSETKSEGSKGEAKSDTGKADTKAETKSSGGSSAKSTS